MEMQETIRPENLRDVLISKIAIETDTSEDIVEKIISFHFKNVVEQTKKVDRVRVNELGTFILSRRKLEVMAGKLSKRIQATQKIIETADEGNIKKKNAIEKLPELKAELEVMQKRLNSL